MSTPSGGAALWMRVGVPMQMLQSGFDVNTADYDGRTALMLACVKVIEIVLRQKGSSPGASWFWPPDTHLRMHACRVTGRLLPCCWAREPT